MKVLCVDASPGKLNDDFKLKFLSVYTVTEEIVRAMTGQRYYGLEEAPPNDLFLTSRFIPVSTIDETEEAKHRELKKIRESLGV